MSRDEKGLEVYMYGPQETGVRMTIAIVTVTQPQCGQYLLTQQLTMEKLHCTTKVVPPRLLQLLATEGGMLMELE